MRGFYVFDFALQGFYVVVQPVPLQSIQGFGLFNLLLAFVD